MLVKNRRSLETHCPKWWTATAATAVIALVLIAATFGEKPDAQTAEEPSVDVVSSAGSEEKFGDEGRKTATAENVVAKNRSANGGNANSAAQGAADQPRAAAPLPHDGQKVGGEELETAKAENDAAKRGTAEGENANSGAARRKILDGLFARATAIKSGRFSTSVQQFENGKMAHEVLAEFLISNEGWRQQSRPSNNKREVRINYGGRSLTLEEMRAPVTSVGVPLPFSFELSIRPSEPIARVSSGAAPVPIYAGTIWYPTTLPYLREHAATAKLVRTEKLNEIETQIVEWPVSSRDVTAAFSQRNDLLAGGGTYRVYVAQQLGFAVTRIEFVDRFGTPQFVFNFSEFKEVAENIYFPMKIDAVDAEEKAIKVLEATRVNEPIDDGEFLLRIPRDTHVVDERPHRGDKVDASGRPVSNRAKHPLRNFQTGAEYPEGLPAKMLEEMDRDVISIEEFRRSMETKAVKAVPPETSEDVPRLPTKPPGITSGPRPIDVRIVEKEPAQPKTSFQYGGKSFDDWRKLLLTDLEPDTRVKAIKALGAFGPATGNAKMVAAAIAEAALKTDVPEEALSGNNFIFQNAACSALAGLGEAGVPVLESELDSKLPKSRRNAVRELVEMAPATGVPVLLKATQRLRIGMWRAEWKYCKASKIPTPRQKRSPTWPNCFLRTPTSVCGSRQARS